MGADDKERLCGGEIVVENGRRGFGFPFIPLFLFFLSILYIGALNVAATPGEDESVEDVRQAIRGNNFDLAIKMCREKLAQDPENYDYHFLLSQAYAFSNRRDEALAVLNKLAARFPRDIDVLLFQARVESWSKHYDVAEAGYLKVLEISPRHSEALTGLAEVSSWQGDYGRAISFYEQVAALQQGPEGQADVCFRLGRVHLWSGNYDRARKYFRLALSIEPHKEEYKQALSLATPRHKDRPEIRYERQVESFSDGRADYVDDRLAFQVRLPQLGPVILKADLTERFRQSDHQFEVEFYPGLWDRAYATMNATYSPKAVHFPEHSFMLEVTQGILTSWDISLGYRKMHFTATPVSIYLGSLGYYFGKQIAFFRWYYTPKGEGDDFSWTASLRRYVSVSSFLYAGLGTGSRPFDIVTEEDYKVTTSAVFFAGVDWIFVEKFRFQLNYTRRTEGKLTRNLLFLSAGFRF